MQILEARGIKCVNASGNNSSISVWKKIEEGEFSIIFTTPESLLSPVGYFFRNIQRNRKSQFHSRLVGVVIDECHCVKNWGSFRPEYRELGTLRICFPNVVFAGFTATITLPTSRPLRNIPRCEFYSYQAISSATQLQNMGCASPTERI